MGFLRGRPCLFRSKNSGTLSPQTFAFIYRACRAEARSKRMTSFDQANLLKAKLNSLKQQDTHFQTFGASEHHYQLNPTLTPQEVADFEQKQASVKQAAPKGRRRHASRQSGSRIGN
jgi:hypothetical protein